MKAATATGPTIARIREATTSKAKAEISEAKAEISEAKAGISEARAGISEARAETNEAKAETNQAKAETSEEMTAAARWQSDPRAALGDSEPNLPDPTRPRPHKLRLRVPAPLGGVLPRSALSDRSSSPRAISQRG
jgi:septal ring factor EnvC (AmiA/AmiB activator)